VGNKEALKRVEGGGFEGARCRFRVCRWATRFRRAVVKTLTSKPQVKKV
jgi:hypothetical protein